MSGIPLDPDGEHLMPLVRGSVTPATWTSHGKAWREWFYPAGALYDAAAAHRATVALLASLRLKGASVSVARKRLAGVDFMLKLRGLGDVTKSFVFL